MNAANDQPVEEAGSAAPARTFPGTRTVSPIDLRHRTFSLGRLVAVAANTLTELTRQKVFYVLIVFGLLLIGSSVFLARFTFQQEFQILKDVSMGAISIFSSLLAIVATARLIPQDTEDRTIYTILAKPVPRFEYLLGKLAGVLMLLAISIAMMTAMFLIVLFIREQNALHETARQFANSPSDQLEGALRQVRASGLNIDILPGVVVVYLKACVLASLTLFISTFASTNIFTIVVMTFVYFIGHLEATAREYWLQENAATWTTRAFLALVALLFPDLQGFNLVDDVVAGATIPFSLFVRTLELGILYTAIYAFLATVVFYGKEL